jgi:hypothetical protein
MGVAPAKLHKAYTKQILCAVANQYVTLLVNFIIF